MLAELRYGIEAARARDRRRIGQFEAVIAYPTPIRQHSTKTHPLSHFDHRECDPIRFRRRREVVRNPKEEPSRRLAPAFLGLNFAQEMGCLNAVHEIVMAKRAPSNVL